MISNYNPSNIIELRIWIGHAVQTEKNAARHKRLISKIMLDQSNFTLCMLLSEFARLIELARLSLFETVSKPLALKIIAWSYSCWAFRWHYVSKNWVWISIYDSVRLWTVIGAKFALKEISMSLKTKFLQSRLAINERVFQRSQKYLCNVKYTLEHIRSCGRIHADNG